MTKNMTAEDFRSLIKASDSKMVALAMGEHPVTLNQRLIGKLKWSGAYAIRVAKAMETIGELDRIHKITSTIKRQLKNESK